MAYSVYVIGIGPGSAEYIPPAAMDAIAEAEVLVAGERTLDAYSHLGKDTLSIKNNLSEVAEFIKKEREDRKIAVLASGDPGLFGILRFLRRHFTPEELCVIPGISAAQLACARLALPWDDAVVLSVHGREPERAVAAVKANKKVVLLTDPRQEPGELARQLKAAGVDKRIYLCENLSYPDEKITELTLEELGRVPGFKNNVMVMTDE